MSDLDPRDPRVTPVPQIEEPDPIPIYKSDEAATARVAGLLHVITSTNNLPKLKPMQDEAMAELEVLGEESRVRREKWNRDNAERNAEFERRKAALRAQLRAQAEAEQRSLNEKAIAEREARDRAALAAGPRVFPADQVNPRAPYDPNRPGTAEGVQQPAQPYDPNRPRTLSSNTPGINGRRDV